MTVPPGRPSHPRPHHEYPTTSYVDALRHWSASQLHHAHHLGPIPLAGSPDWQALDDTDPRKTAAVVRAALAWLHESIPAVIADRLRTELDLIDRCHSDRMNAASIDISGAADWSRIAAGPTLRVLTRRRSTYPCPYCRIRLPFADTHCVQCGWAEPTPQQLRDSARQSWATYDRRPVGEVVA